MGVGLSSEEPGARGGQWRSGTMHGELSSKNGKGSAINHKHCHVHIWEEKRMRSVVFI